MGTPNPQGDLIERAFAAWFRSCGDAVPIQPANTSGLRHHEDREYVVLENVNGVLAVYGVTNAGRLRRLHRWPAEVEAH